MTFRHDINGLRAIAVIAVVLFHFQVPGFSAGFLGVDVFFVISGFLMAAILLRGLENNPSRGGAICLLWSFYLARARRILPALLVLVVVLLVVGWWTLGPEDYERLAKHARSAVVFASNHRFYDEAGYFDVQSHEKWLLHTWSLSVEWQFYLVLPLLLIAAWKLKPSRTLLIGVVGISALVSFVYGQQRLDTNPEAAFYLLPSRAWELLVGAFVYLLAARLSITPKAALLLEGIGLALIVLALFVITPLTPWPGSVALLPVFGTGLVLLAGKQNPCWAMPKSIQWIGTSSYSLYLWHWPVFVALVFLDVQAEPLAIVTGIMLAMLLASLSYAWVEQPSRHGLARLGLRWAAAPLVVAVVGTVSAATAIGKLYGLPQRMPEEFNRIMAETKNINPYRKDCHGHPGMASFPWCMIGGENVKAVVVGDSHAASIVTAVKDALVHEVTDGIVMSTYTSCQPLLGIKKTDERLQCSDFFDFVTDKLAAIPENIPLVISAYLTETIFGSHLKADKSYGKATLYFGENAPAKITNEYLNEVQEKIIESACYLSEKRPVYWLSPFPEMPKNPPRYLARKMLWGGKEELAVSRIDYLDRNKFVISSLEKAAMSCPNFHVIDVSQVYCSESSCYGSRDGMPLYYDEHHISERGNRLLVPILYEAIYKNKFSRSNQLIGDGNLLFYNNPMAQLKSANELYIAFMTHYGKINVASIAI